MRIHGYQRVLLYYIGITTIILLCVFVTWYTNNVQKKKRTGMNEQSILVTTMTIWSTIACLRAKDAVDVPIRNPEVVVVTVEVMRHVRPAHAREPPVSPRDWRRDVVTCRRCGGATPVATTVHEKVQAVVRDVSEKRAREARVGDGVWGGSYARDGAVCGEERVDDRCCGQRWEDKPSRVHGKLVVAAVQEEVCFDGEL